MDNFLLGEIRGLERAIDIVVSMLSGISENNDRNLLDVLHNLNIEINKIKNSSYHKPLFDEPKQLNSFGR